MKAIILILILGSFLQATILPIDLVLMLLILRTYITKEKSNLFLAFWIGLLVSHLSFSPLGLQSAVYLAAVLITQIFSRFHYWNSLLTIVPFMFILLLINSTVLSLVTNQSINIWPGLILESLLALPFYFILRFWEERFIVKHDIKLKV